MEETIKGKSANRNNKLMLLPLNVPKYLAFNAKPDKIEYIKNQRTWFILK